LLPTLEIEKNDWKNNYHTQSKFYFLKSSEINIIYTLACFAQDLQLNATYAFKGIVTAKIDGRWMDCCKT